jgi:hypothetical protein
MKKRPSWAFLILGLVFVLVGLVVIVGSIGAYLKDSSIATQGARATGTITEKFAHRPSGKGPKHRVRYRFSIASGQQFEATSDTYAQEDWERLRVGQPIDIRFDPQDPSRSFPMGQGFTSMTMTVFSSVMGLLATALGALMLYAAAYGTEEPRRITPPRAVALQSLEEDSAAARSAYLRHWLLWLVAMLTVALVVWRCPENC